MTKHPLYPDDLIEKNWAEIAEELFDEDPETYCFFKGDSGAHDRLWYDLMKRLTEKSLQKWIFIH